MYIQVFVCLYTLAFIAGSSGQGIKSPTKSASQLDFVSPVAKHRQSWGVKTVEGLQTPMFKPQPAALMGGQLGYSLTIDHGLSKEPVVPVVKSNRLISGVYDTQVVTSGEQVQPQAMISTDVGPTGWVKESTMVKELPKAVYTQQMHSYTPMIYGAMRTAQPWLYPMAMPMAHHYMVPMAKQLHFTHLAPMTGHIAPQMALYPHALAPQLDITKYVKYAQPWSYTTWSHQPEMHVAKMVKSQVTTGGWTAPLPAQQPELDAQVNMKLDRYGEVVPMPVGKMNLDSQSAVRVDKSFEGISQVKTD